MAGAVGIVTLLLQQLDLLAQALDFAAIVLRRMHRAGCGAVQDMMFDPDIAVLDEFPPPLCRIEGTGVGAGRRWGGGSGGGLFRAETGQGETQRLFVDLIAIVDVGLFGICGKGEGIVIGCGHGVSLKEEMKIVGNV
ncbi:hypothetical protein GCM10023157_19120 [Gluconacetobacter asukensis]